MDQNKVREISFNYPPLCWVRHLLLAGRGQWPVINILNFQFKCVAEPRPTLLTPEHQSLVDRNQNQWSCYVGWVETTDTRSKIIIYPHPQHLRHNPERVCSRKNWKQSILNWHVPTILVWTLADLATEYEQWVDIFWHFDQAHSEWSRYV